MRIPRYVLVEEISDDRMRLSNCLTGISIEAKSEDVKNLLVKRDVYSVALKPERMLLELGVVIRSDLNELDVLRYKYKSQVFDDLSIVIELSAEDDLVYLKRFAVLFQDFKIYIIWSGDIEDRVIDDCFNIENITEMFLPCAGCRNSVGKIRKKIRRVHGLSRNADRVVFQDFEQYTYVQGQKFVIYDFGGFSSPLFAKSPINNDFVKNVVTSHINRNEVIWLIRQSNDVQNVTEYVNRAASEMYRMKQSDYYEIK